MQLEYIISHSTKILTKDINPFIFIKRRFIDQRFKTHITMVRNISNDNRTILYL